MSTKTCNNDFHGKICDYFKLEIQPTKYVSFTCCSEGSRPSDHRKKVIIFYVGSQRILTPITKNLPRSQHICVCVF